VVVSEAGLHPIGACQSRVPRSRQRGMLTPVKRLNPGDRLGEYELLAAVGAGGMGRVWVARARGAPGLERLVAIKTALVEQGNNDEACRVLLDEARIASRVQHTNVCAIHEANRDRSLVYLVMDWSDGGSLHELLEACPGRRIDHRLAARIATRVCAGLEAVHDLVSDSGEPLGVVHRDVSPQNILISTSGQIRLTDFGVAKARGQLHAPTQTGEVKGKLSYMAPEQVTRKHVDRRADVFALGCVLYESTTGKRPFVGDDAVATMYQLLEAPVVPPTQLQPDYPPALEAIVLCALQRDPADRYANAAELARALEGYLVSERAVVGELEVAQLLRGRLSPVIQARGQAIAAAMGRLDARTPSRRPDELAALSRPPRRSSVRHKVWFGVSTVSLGTVVAATFVGSWTWVNDVRDDTTSSYESAPMTPVVSSAERIAPSLAPLSDDLAPSPLRGAPLVEPTTTAAVARPGADTREHRTSVRPTSNAVRTVAPRARTMPRSAPSLQPAVAPADVVESPAAPSTPAVYSPVRPPRELDTRNPYAPEPTG